MTSFKTLVASSAGALAVALTASAAHAAILVFDDFEGYTPTVHGDGAYDLDFTAFTDLHVEDGSVDLIGTPNAWSLVGASNYVDLDGTTSPPNGGLLRTDAFTLVAGQRYTLSLSLAGNQRGGTDQWDFGFQTADSNNIAFNNVVVTGFGLDAVPGCSSCDGPAIGAGSSALPFDSAWHPYSISFTAGGTGTFTAYVGTTSADNIGPLVDDFALATVPEPAAWALMLLGFGGMGAMIRRRRATAFAL